MDHGASHWSTNALMVWDCYVPLVQLIMVLFSLKRYSIPPVSMVPFMTAPLTTSKEGAWAEIHAAKMIYLRCLLSFVLLPRSVLCSVSPFSPLSYCTNHSSIFHLSPFSHTNTDHGHESKVALDVASEKEVAERVKSLIETK